MRVVLDTNVLIRAAADSEGLAGRRLQELLTTPHVLLVSLPILSEITRVLAYPRLRQRWRLNDEQVRDFVSRLAAVAAIVHTNAPAAHVVAADPDDDPIVETAVAGRADVLCTRDSHLFTIEVVEYCAQRGVTVMDDVQLRNSLSR